MTNVVLADSGALKEPQQLPVSETREPHLIAKIHSSLPIRKN